MELLRLSKLSWKHCSPFNFIINLLKFSLNEVNKLRRKILYIALRHHFYTAHQVHTTIHALAHIHTNTRYMYTYSHTHIHACTLIHTHAHRTHVEKRCQHKKLNFSILPSSNSFFQFESSISSDVFTNLRTFCTALEIPYPLGKEH